MKIAAHLILVATLEEQPGQQLALLRGQGHERRTHAFPVLAGGNRRVGARLTLVGGIEVFLQRHGLRPRPIHLEDHVVADRVDERAERFGRLYAALASQGRKDAREGLLLRILDLFAGAKTRPQLQRQQVAEVAREVGFCVRISRTEPLQIGAIELVTG